MAGYRATSAPKRANAKDPSPQSGKDGTHMEEQEWQPVRIAPLSHVSKFHLKCEPDDEVGCGQIIRVRPTGEIRHDQWCEGGKCYEIHPEDRTRVGFNEILWSYPQLICEHGFFAD